MNPEDFTDPKLPDHPEVNGAELEMQRPEQATLCLLMDVIGEKTSNGRKVGYDKISVSLKDPHDPSSMVSIWRTKESTNPTDEHIGNVQKREASVDGDTIVTNYTILSIPDGLHIKKDTHLTTPNEGITVTGNSEEGLRLDMGLHGLYMAMRMATSISVQGELGLDFVSELEVRELTDYLGQLEIRDE